MTMMMIAENIHSMICIASYFKERQCWFLDFMIITVSVLFLSKGSVEFFYMICCSKRPHRENININSKKRCKTNVTVSRWLCANFEHIHVGSFLGKFNIIFCCVVISIIIIWLSIFLSHRTHNWQQTIGRQITTCSI